MSTTKHPRANDLHINLQVLFCYKIHMRLCSLSHKCLWISFNFFFHKTRNVLSIFKRSRVDRHVLNKASPSKIHSPQNNEQTTFFTRLGRYYCPVLFFSLHFVLISIHPLAWLSALCMPVLHSGGPPGEQTHTGGYGAVPQSPLPPCPPTSSLLPSTILSASSCLTMSLPICLAVCLMTWLLIRPEAQQCPAPGASTSHSYKVSRAVSQMG